MSALHGTTIKKGSVMKYEINHLFFIKPTLFLKKSISIND
jgi:hypothetical protein